MGAIVAAMSMGGSSARSSAPALGRRLGTARAILLCQAWRCHRRCSSHSPAPAPVGRRGGRRRPVGAGVVAGNVIKGSWRQAYTPPRSSAGSSHACTWSTTDDAAGCARRRALASWLGVRDGIWCAATWLTLTCGFLMAGPLRHRRDLPDHPHTSAFSARRSSAADRGMSVASTRPKHDRDRAEDAEVRRLVVRGRSSRRGCRTWRCRARPRGRTARPSACGTPSARAWSTATARPGRAAARRS